MNTALLSIDCGTIAEDGRITVPIHPDHAGILTDPMRDLADAPFVYITDDPRYIGYRYDREHNIENIWRIYAALEAYSGVYIIDTYGGYDSIHPRHVNFYKKKPLVFDPKGGFELKPNCHYGSNYDITTDLTHKDIDPDACVIGPVGDMLLPLVDKTYGHPSRYLFNNTTKAMLHRDTLVLDTQEDSVDALIEFVEKHGDKIFIKNALSKDVSGVVDTDNFNHKLNKWSHTNYEPELEEALNALIDPEHNEQFQMWAYRTPRFVSVQETRSLYYETRFFCVDGRIVSAAGRIMNYVPDWESNIRPYTYADVATVYPSQDKDTQQPQCNPYYTQMNAAARDNVKTIVANNPDMNTFVMDMAWDADLEQPVLVEINGLSNAGFYGASPRVIYRELMHVDDSARLTYRATQDYIAELIDKTQLS